LPSLAASSTSVYPINCHSFRHNEATEILIKNPRKIGIASGMLSHRSQKVAEFSSEMQREASIDDQIRVCTAHLERDGWSVVETYADHAVSGATALRSGYQALLRDARAGRFDLVIAEALDRFSRDQERIAAFYKLMSFAGIAVVTLTEGVISELHAGLTRTSHTVAG
jgi:hypothetical protein